MTALVCTVGKCPRPHHGRGFCVTHYRRWKKYGHVNEPTKAPEVKRDCRCKTVRHEHGTLGAYQTDKCRCAECRAVSASRVQQRKRALAYGRWQDGIVTDITGLQRRLQGLIWMGWTVRDIAKECGTGYDTLHRMLGIAGRDARNQRQSTADVARRIEAGFSRLAQRQPPTSGQATRARNYARKQGWVSAWAWDDIDDPDETPKGVGSQADRLTDDELLRELAVLRSAGDSEENIAKRLGMTEKQLYHRLYAIRHKAS